MSYRGMIIAGRSWNVVSADYQKSDTAKQVRKSKIFLMIKAEQDYATFPDLPLWPLSNSAQKNYFRIQHFSLSQEYVLWNLIN